MKERFLIPGGLLPSSVDPLEIDQFNNHFTGQMVYSSPLMTSIDGKLTSNILSEFDYNPGTAQIRMKVGEWQYSSGEQVTIEDVALAIKRMTLKRPFFPVLREIAGVAEWVKEKIPLKTSPHGIKINDNELFINLSRPVYQPLFRFALNIFSVIPGRCVNLHTNTLTCEKPPSSGFFTEMSRDKTQIVYRKRKDLSAPSYQEIPDEVVFDYADRDIAELLNEEGYHSVVFCSDAQILPEKYDELTKTFHARRLASSWFSGFVLNPRIQPFNSTSCRIYFAAKFREHFKRQYLGMIEPSSSIFSKILPGHMSSEEMLNEIEIDEGQCKQKFSDLVLNFGIRSSTVPPLVEKSLASMSQEIGFKIGEAIRAKGSHTGWPSYDRDDVGMQLSNSGFWPLDPVGDVQMLLTPGMHEDYMDINTHPQLMRMINALSLCMDNKGIHQLAKDLNLYLFKEGLFNIYSNNSYFFLSRKDLTKDTKGGFSLTVPYPWQVF